VVAGGLRVEADYCVVTAPLPALRAVDLHLNLPRRVREAIARVQYGDVVKTALQYRRRFWADEGWSGTTVADLPIQASWDATGSQPGAGGVLMTYSAGREAERVGAAPVRARIDSAERQLAQVYPGSDGLAVAGASVAWGRERYSGGAYSAWGPGQYTRYWAALRRPYGRVHFAGEHTDVYASYMEGAVRSGQRVATAIEARRG
jgi:monoamine oxidase